MPAPTQAVCDAWTPGITSQIPESLKPQITLFRAENATVDYRRACEYADFCGLSVNTLFSLRVERLVVHELLVRVTADLTVPDGPNYQDLGINLRAMVAELYKYALPEFPAMRKAFDQDKAVLMQFIESEIQTRLFSQRAASVKPKPDISWLRRLFGGVVTSEVSASSKSPEEPVEVVALANWKQRIVTETSPLQLAALQALVKVVGSMVAIRGRVMNRPGLIADIATNMACNNTGSTMIAKLVEPVFKAGVAAHNYRLLPVQLKPLVMNVKGASASGKSTIRPQQRQLAEKLNILWEDFALISPDYWRKYLLDYGSLGDNYKYAAMLTGQELEIVDAKLDHHMAQKAASGEVSHLLIDRFRFDSFNVGNGGHSRDSKLLSRFGHQIFLYFMITPPADTVVRAWERGQTTGRFKAVDDLLYHNIEAYTGMPDLFLSWVHSGDKQLHFEFLDNSVEKGQPPKTAAFGWNNAMTIFDVDLMRAVECYKKVNVNAATAAQVLTEESPGGWEPCGYGEFLRRCLGTIRQVSFAESDSGNIYAQLRDGKMIWWNKAAVEKRPEAAFLKSLFAQHAESLNDLPVRSEAIIDAVAEKQYTLGQW